MDLNQYTTNVSKSNEGVWVEHDSETSFLIARMNNANFQKVFNRSMKPYRKMFEDGKLSMQRQNDVLCNVMAETILLDWKGLHFDGVEVPYSKEKALELLKSDGNDEFRELILSYAQDNETYRNEKLDKSVKNLKTG